MDLYARRSTHRWEGSSSKSTWRFMGSYKSRVLSPLIWVTLIVTLLLTPLMTTHEPPSRHVRKAQRDCQLPSTRLSGSVRAQGSRLPGSGPPACGC